MGIILFLVVLLLSGCTAAFGPDVPVTLVFQTPEDIKRDYAEQFGQWGALGYAEMTSEGCRVYVPRPRGRDDIERWHILYHELSHCWKGNFHGP